MTTSDIERGLGICEAASPPPWTYHAHPVRRDWLEDKPAGIEHGDPRYYADAGALDGPILYPDPEATYFTVEDAAFMCYARTALPAALLTLQRIVALCERHNSPAVNVGAHGLAGEILRIIQREEG